VYLFPDCRISMHRREALRSSFSKYHSWFFTCKVLNTFGILHYPIIDWANCCNPWYSKTKQHLPWAFTARGDFHVRGHIRFGYTHGRKVWSACRVWSLSRTSCCVTRPVLPQDSQVRGESSILLRAVPEFICENCSPIRKGAKNEKLVIPSILTGVRAE
jgi:hypothetical protein